jgi:hypothetical protein
MRVNLIDDFGNEIRPVLDLNAATVFRFIRFALDGAIEGIASGVIKGGDADESSLKYFGLVAV